MTEVEGRVPARSAPRTESGTRTAARPRVAALRLLAVDDRPEMLRALTALLETQGHLVVTAQNGGEAIDLLERSAFDVVLLDLLMPGVSGHGVIEHATARALDLKIIVVSGDPSFAGVKQALTRGAWDFVKKPYEPGELLATVERAGDALLLEREHRALERRLRASERLHRFVVNASPDLVYLLDAQGRFTFCNDRFGALVGHAPEALVGRHWTEVVAPEDPAAARHAFAERRAGDRAARDVELRIVTGDADQCTGPRTRVIELTAFGVYEDPEHVEARGFIGTYGTARDVTERKSTEAAVNFRAYHDVLTHLPNRALFEDRLGLAITQARRNREQVAVMFLDLDRFKVVNDALGHPMGDRLLKAVAHRLKSCLRKGDTLSRFGGDEFTLLLPEVGSRDDVVTIARKILEQIGRPFHVDGHELAVGVSIGIALFPEAGETVGALVRNADIAMYHTKGRGKNGFEFFTDRMSEQYASRLALERELVRGIRADQLDVHFQPQVGVGTRTREGTASGPVVSVEALARWRHPRRGVLLPGEFMGLAEASGLVTGIDDFVHDRALGALAAWDAAGLPAVDLALNVSGARLLQEGFAAGFRNRLAEHGVAPGRVRLEVRESVIMTDLDRVVPQLRALSGDGVQIAVDGFGTGCGALTYLQQLPVTVLEIDRAFVHEISAGAGPGGHRVVDGILAMARGLGLGTVAEGVESRRQLHYLQARGCPLVQGFVHHRPMPRAQIEALLRAQGMRGEAAPGAGGVR